MFISYHSCRKSWGGNVWLIRAPVRRTFSCSTPCRTSTPCCRRARHASHSWRRARVSCRARYTHQGLLPMAVENPEISWNFWCGSSAVFFRCFDLDLIETRSLDRTYLRACRFWKNSEQHFVYITAQRRIWQLVKSVQSQ